MTSHSSPPPTLEVAVATAVDRLTARYGWQLAERTTLIRDALAVWQSGAADSPERAVVYTYSLLRYRCCRGAEGRTRRDQAFAELGDELYNLARTRDPARAADIVQTTLDRIFTRLSDVRLPGTFIAFCLLELHSAERKIRRLEDRDLTWSDQWDVDDPEPDLAIPDPEPPILESVADADLAVRVRAALAAHLVRYPRSEVQLDVLVLEFFEGLRAPEIALRLGQTTPQVYVLRHRALKRLAQDPACQTLAAELGLRDHPDRDIP